MRGAIIGVTTFCWVLIIIAVANVGDLYPVKMPFSTDESNCLDVAKSTLETIKKSKNEEVETALEKLRQVLGTYDSDEIGNLQSKLRGVSSNPEEMVTVLNEVDSALNAAKNPNNEKDIQTILNLVKIIRTSLSKK